MSTELIIVDAAAWQVWLGEHHQESDGVWLVLAKKNVTTPTSLTYDEALEEALCHGWIDGQRRSRDEQTFIQRYTPRRTRSMWSKRNVDLVAQLEQDGRMRPAGRAEIERAKSDGRWDKAYGGASAKEIPEDLAAALAANPKAQAMFEILTSANRFAIVHRVNDAKRPETRAKRITLYVGQLARGETIYPQKRTL
ncbi:YdeI/OmpD-associated family protein [Kribbella sp. NBC_00709]|uniref:YdeI/OmpD-associated family protein n=1 Tax=Kribbella sp. NBC_00709 TaxID=2975972 RepID=UPI002E2CA623|nr:YdeI/OmpD-associated family protein [Kribbella sp. NBC_00709]